MKLKSVLGRRDVFALAFGAIIGWGWVVLSGSMIDRAGTLGSVVAVGIGAVMVSFVGLTYAELTSALPRAGGELAFTYRALGPQWSWLCGWSLVLAYGGVCAFEAVAIATVVAYLFPGLQLGYLYSVAGSDVYASWILIGLASAALVGLANWFGIKSSARLQQAATFVLLLVGVSFFLGSNLFGETANLRPRFTDLEGLLRVVILTPFLMVGFDVIPQASEEVNIPQRELGKIILFSIGLAAVWYALVQWGVGLALSHEVHRASELPTADAAQAVFGFRGAAHILVFGGLMGIVTSWNSFFVGGTRLLFGMSRAKMLPARFADLHPTYGSPRFAVMFMTAISMFAPFLGRKALVWVADAASLAVVVAYFLVALSFVMLRRKEPEMPRPYKLRYPGFIGYAAVLISFGFILLYMPFSPSGLVWPYEWAIVAFWSLLGAAAYALGKRAHPHLDLAEQEQIIFGEFARGPASAP